jgi:hypothetical protein
MAYVKKNPFRVNNYNFAYEMYDEAKSYAQEKLSNLAEDAEVYAKEKISNLTEIAKVYTQKKIASITEVVKKKFKSHDIDENNVYIILFAFILLVLIVISVYLVFGKKMQRYYYGIKRTAYYNNQAELNNRRLDCCIIMAQCVRGVEYPLVDSTKQNEDIDSNKTTESGTSYASCNSSNASPNAIETVVEEKSPRTKRASAPTQNLNINLLSKQSMNPSK